MKWRIYYGDETVFEGQPEDAPVHNVQAIAYVDDDPRDINVGRVVLESWDFYLYSDHVGGWHGTNKFTDILMHLERGCGPGGVRAVLRGLWIERAKFLKIVNRAKTDAGLPPKSSVKPPIEDGAA